MTLLSFFFFFLVPLSLGGGLSVPIAASGFMPMEVTSRAAAARMPTLRSANFRFMAEFLLSEHQLHNTTKPPVQNKTNREGGLVLLGIEKFRPSFHRICRRLDLLRRSREHFVVLVPRLTSGTKEGTRTRQIRTLEFEGIRGCPRNCERRALGPTRPLGNWEGRTTKATTREPGDLPVQSPNRWTGSPYGAVFRSGDGNAGAKSVRANSF